MTATATMAMQTIVADTSMRDLAGGTSDSNNCVMASIGIEFVRRHRLLPTGMEVAEQKRYQRRSQADFVEQSVRIGVRIVRVVQRRREARVEQIVMVVAIGAQQAADDVFF